MDAYESIRGFNAGNEREREKGTDNGEDFQEGVAGAVECLYLWAGFLARPLGGKELPHGADDLLLLLHRQGGVNRQPQQASAD